VLNPCVSDVVRFINVTDPVTNVTQAEIWFISDGASAADIANILGGAPLPPAPGVTGSQQETFPATRAGNVAQIYRVFSFVGINGQTKGQVARMNITSDFNNLLVQSDTVSGFADVPAMSPAGVIALSLLLLAVGGFFIGRRGSLRIG